MQWSLLPSGLMPGSLNSTHEGRQIARAKGVRMGRKPKLTPHLIKEARQRLAKGEPTRDLAKSYGVASVRLPGWRQPHKCAVHTVRNGMSAKVIWRISTMRQLAHVFWGFIGGSIAWFATNFIGQPILAFIAARSEAARTN